MGRIALGLSSGFARAWKRLAGVSSRLISYLKPGEPFVVMVPTGTPTEIPTGEAVLLAGGGLGNAVLFSIAKALKDNGKTYELYVYEGANHAFNNDTNEARYNKDVAELAWGRTVEFLRKYVAA